jgi:hypothetical protein
VRQGGVGGKSASWLRFSIPLHSPASSCFCRLLP